MLLKWRIGTNDVGAEVGVGGEVGRSSSLWLRKWELKSCGSVSWSEDF